MGIGLLLTVRPDVGGTELASAVSQSIEEPLWNGVGHVQLGCEAFEENEFLAWALKLGE